MKMEEAKKIKQELVKWGKWISDKGLVVGPGGNTSARCGDTIYMKASGIAFEEAKKKHYIGVDLRSGKVVEGKLKPTSELPMHLACYRVRDDIKAVVHTHPPLATGIASAGKTIPPIFPDYIAYIGKEIPLIGYIVPTGEKLAKAVAEKIRNHNALLMANHGILTVGSNLKEASYRNLLVEEAARTFLVSKIIGKPHLLTKKEIEDIDKLSAEAYRRKLLK